MADRIRHRGPDDEGIETRASRADGCDDVGVAFRRLSIIDLSSAGHQPMASDDGKLLMVFNGEIYNAPELTLELERGGAVFRGHSDTEVILRLYEQSGTRAFARLNGMFAIALWDGRTKKLHLVRDRLGIKPLYYAQVGGAVLFASEIKSLLCHPAIRRAFDPVGVADYMSFQFCLGETTIFDGIKLLSPATIQTYDRTKATAIPSRERFWRWEHKPQPRRTLADTAQELRETMERVLKRQTRSDVPVGTFLSSGMDTGAISALATRHLPGMHSFTCGFDTAGIASDEVLSDERADSEALAKRLGTTHHVLTLGARAMRDYFDRTIWHMESPQVGISYQILAMAEVIKPHTSVVLSGTGGDELFAGYHWRYQPLLGEKNPEVLDEKLYRQWCRLLDDETRGQVLEAPYHDSPRARFHAVMEECDSQLPLSRMLHFERSGFLHGLLQLDDKLNMAASVEARVPLLDNEIFDLAETIPDAMKYDGITTKIVLKQALSGLLPDDVITRRKQGFTPPDAHHLRHANREWVRERLLSTGFKEMGVVKEGAPERILEEHITGMHNHRFLIWAMLCLHGVQECFIEK